MCLAPQAAKLPGIDRIRKILRDAKWHMIFSVITLLNDTVCCIAIRPNFRKDNDFDVVG